MHISFIFSSAEISTQLELSLFCSKISAGFPSPAEDAVELSLDLNNLIVAHPSSTFFVRVEGESMSGAGIVSGDMLVVDRSLTPKSGDIVVAILEGEFTVKRWLKRNNSWLLLPENNSFNEIEISPGSSEHNFEIWGVVTYAVHCLRSNLFKSYNVCSR